MLTRYRSLSIGLRWLVVYASKRKGKSMAGKLAGEILEGAKGQGNAWKKKEEIQKMAKANKAFAKFARKKLFFKKKRKSFPTKPLPSLSIHFPPKITPLTKPWPAFLRPLQKQKQRQLARRAAQKKSRGKAQSTP